MKRPVLAILGVAALAALGWWWFVTHYEQVEIKVPVGASAASRANPYLAAMRFAERLGWKANLEEQPARMVEMPVRTSILLPAGRAWLTPTRAQALLHAAENGAHLIVEPEPERQRDPLLEALEVGRRTVQPNRGHFDARFPGAEAPLRLGSVGNQVIDPGRAHVDIAIADARGPRIVSLRRGSGRVTVMTGMQRFDNRHIGSHDHAELLRRVLALAPADRLLVVRAGGPPLWSWLVEHGSQVMIAAAMLLALALWRIAPRFGPIAPSPEPARRQLLEHLRAAGRFRWSRGARQELLSAAREQLERHIALAAPRLAHLPPSQRYVELSAQLGTDAETVAGAFQAAPRNARELVHIAATLASIHAGLRGARPRFRPQRKRT
ncbi:MAG: DUF4350 domain-containing protein [Burkholderiales bacterium]